ncbi:unnamed protein product, partial [Meganyctiphanes norvegica]
MGNKQTKYGGKSADDRVLDAFLVVVENVYRAIVQNVVSAISVTNISTKGNIYGSHILTEELHILNTAYLISVFSYISIVWPAIIPYFFVWLSVMTYTQLMLRRREQQRRADYLTFFDYLEITGSCQYQVLQRADGDFDNIVSSARLRFSTYTDARVAVSCHREDQVTVELPHEECEANAK